MLRPPVEPVIFFPFPFECLAVAGPGPEFRLFHENGVDACIYHPFHVLFFHVLQVILRRDDIRDHVPVPDSVTFYCHLTLVEVPFPIPFAGEVVLVLAPGYTCHEMGDIPPVSPGFHPFFECESFPVLVGRVSAHAVDHHCIGPVVNGRSPFPRRLEGRLHTVFLRSCGTCIQCGTQPCRAKQNRSKSPFHFLIISLMFKQNVKLEIICL